MIVFPFDHMAVGGGAADRVAVGIIGPASGAAIGVGGFDHSAEIVVGAGRLVRQRFAAGGGAIAGPDLLDIAQGVYWISVT